MIEGDLLQSGLRALSGMKKMFHILIGDGYMKLWSC